MSGGSLFMYTNPIYDQHGAICTRLHSERLEATAGGLQFRQEFYHIANYSRILPVQEHSLQGLDKAVVLSDIPASLVHGRIGSDTLSTGIFATSDPTIRSVQPDAVDKSDKPDVLPSRVPLSFNAARQQGRGTFDIVVRESPVRWTPPEIWMAVFSEICNISTYSFEVGKKKNAAFVISHVCRQWRDIAIESCTRFWSTLIIDAGSSGRRGHTKGWAELTAMALNRSKGREVSVVFVGSDRQCVGPRLVEALRQVMDRSQCLWNLELRLHLSFIPLLSALVGRIPILRRCTVHFMGDTISADHQIDAFAIAPRLKQLTLTGFGPGSTFSIPYSSVISYEDVRDCRVSEGVHESTIRYLQYSPHVRFFRAVYQRPWMGRFRAIEPPVECPSVRVFAASQGALFRSVMLPSVHSIIIESKPPDGILDFTDGDCLPAVHNLVVRSQCYTTLHQLSIYDTRITYYNVFNILTDLRFLTTLVFGFTRWYEACDAVIHDIIVALSVTVGEDAIGPYRVAPALLHLVVTASEPLDDGRGSIGFVCSHFADMVEGRCSRLAGHLGKFSVMVKVGSPFLDFPRMSDEVITRLVECRRMGHDICVAGYIDGDFMNNIVESDN